MATITSFTLGKSMKWEEYFLGQPVHSIGGINGAEARKYVIYKPKIIPMAKTQDLMEGFSAFEKVYYAQAMGRLEEVSDSITLELIPHLRGLEKRWSGDLLMGDSEEDIRRSLEIRTDLEMIIKPQFRVHHSVFYKSKDLCANV